MQLRFRLQTTKADRLDAVWRVAAEEGWELDPRSQSGKERWQLPGTRYYLRANWHTTTVYRLIDHRAAQQQSVPSDALGLVRLLLQRARLEAKRSRGR